ncbi:unnamed protein product [Adineta ricciae]|uniref:Ubiquitin-like domain-containing protein n=1 Tax=Adineta ricciae TaxID=249248 RepID=A0A813UPW3_ADIRI|nr:unnamed protein product [Adineta ricciae]
MGTKSISSDIINLKLILVSGKTAEFQFRPTTTAADIAKYVFENWPEGWASEEKADRFEVLRLIYQGRFLHGNVTLNALHLQQGKTTVMHLVQREHLPEPTNGDQKRKHKHDNNQEETPAQPLPSNSTSGCCDACSIL